MSTPFDHIPSATRSADYTKPTAMSRREEVEAEILEIPDRYMQPEDGFVVASGLARTLADEIDALRADRDNAVKNGIDRLPDAPWKDKTATEAVWLLSLALTGAMAANEDLYGTLNALRMAQGCTRGQRTTQYCAEAADRDRVIGELLAMLKPPTAPKKPCRFSDWCTTVDQIKVLDPLYARACQIAGRTE